MHFAEGRGLSRWGERRSSLAHVWPLLVALASSQAGCTSMGERWETLPEGSSPGGADAASGRAGAPSSVTPSSTGGTGDAPGGTGGADHTQAGNGGEPGGADPALGGAGGTHDTLGGAGGSAGGVRVTTGGVDAVTGGVLASGGDDPIGSGGGAGGAHDSRGGAGDSGGDGGRHGGGGGATGNDGGRGGEAGGLACPETDAAPVGGEEGPSCPIGDSTRCNGESCCASLYVPGGTFPMGRSIAGCDAVEVPPDQQSLNDVPEHWVTVSPFFLDKYEVTVARFRAFIDGKDWLPEPNAGAHPNIPATGWQATWDAQLPGSKETWDAVLEDTCSYSTWTSSSGGNETLPIACTTWYEAAAFCIWDGGRLPTEAELEFTAAGGTQNRLYPWGSELPDDDCRLLNWAGCNSGVRVVGLSPAGAGRWGHLDLSGNVYEIAFDAFDANWYNSPVASGTDPCNTEDIETRVNRGGGYGRNALGSRSASRYSIGRLMRSGNRGLRCARSP